MRSLGVVLAGARAAISVGDDNVRSGPRPGLSLDDLHRLSIALLDTGLTVKAGTQQSSKVGGPYSITSHVIWQDNTGVLKAGYENETKFLGTFLLKCFPSADEFEKARAAHPEATQATILRMCKVRPPTDEQTAAYKFFLRHEHNEKFRNHIRWIYQIFGWQWDSVVACQEDGIIHDLL